MWAMFSRISHEFSGRATLFEPVANPKAAKLLGVAFPSSILVRGDEAIE